MKNNTKILYGIIGLLIGVIIGGSAVSFHHRRGDSREYASESGTHRMPDGTLMSNSGSHMETMMGDMMAELEGKTGDAFDKAFLEEMIVHHEGAVEMAKAVLENSKQPELIKLATNIISTQTREIETMREWQAAWFK
ncbi:MAG: DUF305 domain-containing protein [Patescibacteria group bacterium]